MLVEQFYENSFFVYQQSCAEIQMSLVIQFIQRDRFSNFALRAETWNFYIEFVGCLKFNKVLINNETKDLWEEKAGYTVHVYSEEITNDYEGMSNKIFCREVVSTFQFIFL